MRGAHRTPPARKWICSGRHWPCWALTCYNASQWEKQRHMMYRLRTASVYARVSFWAIATADVVRIETTLEITAHVLREACGGVTIVIKHKSRIICGKAIGGDFVLTGVPACSLSGVGYCLCWALNCRS